MATERSASSGRHRSVYTANRRRAFGRSRSIDRRRETGRRHGGGRRWPRRALLGLVSLLALVIALAGATYGYVHTTLDGIHREPVSALTPVRSGQPVDILLVGSDSRQCESTAAQAAAFGSKTTETGQRSDTLLVARFLSGGKVEMLSIPRDLYVPIAGTNGSARVNSAFDNGPNPLVETIQRDLRIPINHVMMVNFCGFPDVVNSLGGLYMDFPDPVYDRYTGLDVRHTGCQLVNGTEALQLVRSRHLYYYAGKQWHYDEMSDFSRIKRQQEFFHALADRIHSVVPDVFRLSSFASAVAKSIAVDSSFSANSMIALGWDYHSVGLSGLFTSVLPTSEAVIGGADVLLPVPVDRSVVRAFLSGRTSSFVAALAPPPRSGAQLAATIVNPNALKEPWNPYPCSL